MSEYELLKAQLRPLSWSDIDARFGVPMDQTMRKAAAAIETLESKLDGLQDRLNAANKARAYVMGMALKKQGKIDALEAKLAICEKYRDAYAECDRIGTQAVRDMEVKLAKAHEKEIAVWSENYAAMERKLYAARAGTKKAEAYAEELEKERDRWREIANNEAVEGEANRNAGLALEAKLAKAAEALRSVDDEYSDLRWGPELSSIKQARAALAEIEGAKG